MWLSFFYKFYCLQSEVICWRGSVRSKLPQKTSQDSLKIKWITGICVYTHQLWQRKKYLNLFIAPTKSLMHSDKHEASVVYYTSIALGCAAIAYTSWENVIASFAVSIHFLLKCATMWLDAVTPSRHSIVNVCNRNRLCI